MGDRKSKLFEITEAVQLHAFDLCIHNLLSQTFIDNREKIYIIKRSSFFLKKKFFIHFKVWVFFIFSILLILFLFLVHHLILLLYFLEYLVKIRYKPVLNLQQCIVLILYFHFSLRQI